MTPGYKRRCFNYCWTSTAINSSLVRFITVIDSNRYCSQTQYGQDFISLSLTTDNYKQINNIYLN